MLRLRLSLHEVLAHKFKMRIEANEAKGRDENDREHINNNHIGDIKQL